MYLHTTHRSMAAAEMSSKSRIINIPRPGGKKNEKNKNKNSEIQIGIIHLTKKQNR